MYCRGMLIIGLRVHMYHATVSNGVLVHMCNSAARDGIGKRK